jgi:hypothetical protein
MIPETRNPYAGPLTAADLEPVTWGRPGRGAWPMCNGNCGEACICKPPLDAEDEIGRILVPGVRAAVSVALVAAAAAGVLMLFPLTFGG